MEQLSGHLPGLVGSYPLCATLRNAMYCAVLGAMPSQNSDDVSPPIVGQCVPKNCTPGELLEWIARVPSLAPIVNGTVVSVLCDTPLARSWDIPAWMIVVLVVVSIFVTSVVVATIYDVVFAKITLRGVPVTALYPSREGGVVKVLTRHQQQPSRTPNDLTEPLLQGGDGTPPPGGQSTLARLEIRWEELRLEMPNLSSLKVRWVLCFSLYTSLRRWNYFRPEEASTNVFNSLRTMCWLWLVMSDTYSMTARIPTYTVTDGWLLKARHSAMFALFDGRTCRVLSIATLIFISGFTTMHRLHLDYDTSVSIKENILRQRELSKSHRVRRWVLRYVRRLIQQWLRLIPLFIVVVVLTQVVFIRAGSGPYWAAFSQNPMVVENCRTWRILPNVFFINNVYPPTRERRCMPWTFYFSLEWQLFAMAPWLHWTYRRTPTAAFAAIVAAVSAAGMAAAVWTDAAPAPSADPTNFFTSDGFGVPWVMVVPFLGGATLQLLYRAVRERADRLKLLPREAEVLLDHARRHGTTMSDRGAYHLLALLRRKAVRIAMIWTGAAVLVGCVGVMWFTSQGQALAKTHPSVAPIVVTVPLGVGLTAMLLPMLFGYGGVLFRFFAHGGWGMSSRLVFAGYLIHPLVVAMSNASAIAPTPLQWMAVMKDVWAHVTLGLIGAFVLHLVIEQPALHLGVKV